MTCRELADSLGISATAVSKILERELSTDERSAAITSARLTMLQTSSDADSIQLWFPKRIR